ncbi:urease accessory protein D isoform X3 [Dendrobium catenatum]|uniref:urease accessory protein D isoform X3 n=1 Tax=Dendrobium catenatum TaxID=906689 RepID=UPI0009F28602|nr:urease accessory protein D isoform X3 [Dendrobium catenatum]
MEETGFLTVEKIDGKSTVTRCFSKYPLKLIIPNKAGSSTTDAVWVFSLSYGGGIVSGDRVVVGLSVGDGCTVALTTQASTKVYKSVDSKCSEQVLEAKVGRNALLAVIPDPVTCFSAAIYSQKQVLLEQTSTTSVAERMKDYQVVAMVIILGPKLKHLQDLIQSEVEHMMTGNFRPTKVQKMSSESSANGPSRPPIFASCSSFGAKAGVVVRLLSTTTEAVYAFLRHHLSGLEQFLGAPPYRR